MQLASVLAQPPAEKSAGLPPFLNILTTLRGDKPAEPVAAPAVAAPAQSVAAQVSEPSLGAKLLASVGSKQNQYLANQQTLALISAGLGERFTTIAKSVWATLRGTAPTEQTSEA